MKKFGGYVNKFYAIKYLGRNSIHYKYSIRERGKLITEFISSEELNLKNKTIRNEVLKEMTGIIEKHDIDGI